MTLDADILVVGAGPVGLAAAIHARLAGYTVRVLDHRTGPVDKACGEGLMPGALAAALGLGIDPPGHPLRGIAYVSGHRRQVHHFTGAPGRGVRRTALSAALLARATALGAVVQRGRVTDVVHEPGAVVAAGIRARWLLGCDGLHSTVRHAVGLTGTTTRRRRYGLRCHYGREPWNDLVEVHWGHVYEAYVTPVDEHTVGLAILGPRGTSLDVALAGLPELEGRFAGAPRVTSVRGAGPLRQTASGRTTGRVRLVGDAAGYVDALTGEGLAIGFAQAAAAIKYVDDAAAYERAWVTATRDYRALTGGLLAVATSPLRGAIVPAAVALPGVYAWIVDRVAGTA